MIIRTRELPRWNGVMLVGISRGGWYRAWSATSEPVKETDQSCLKKTFPRTILFLVLGSEKKRKHGRG